MTRIWYVRMLDPQRIAVTGLTRDATFLVEARIDGMELGAIYKPRRGERPLWDFPQGTLCQREVAAYELSDALGWDIVPLTIRFGKEEFVDRRDLSIEEFWRRCASSPVRR